MKTEDSRQENVVEEAMAECRPWLPLSQRGRDVLATVVAVAAVFGVLWWIGFSLVSRLENRLMDRIDELDRNTSASFKQIQEQMDRKERTGGRSGGTDDRMNRIESDIDRIESDVNAIEKHLLRIGSAIELDRSPAGIDPADAAPD